MAFVSNKQKNINAKNINAKYGRKKFFIIFTLFCLVAFITLLALSIFLGGTYKQISFVEPTMPVGISYFGWVMACSAILLFIMIIVSIVFLAKFENPQKIIKASQDNRNTDAARKGRAKAKNYREALMKVKEDMSKFAY